MIYLLDSNIFIEAKNSHYKFSFCSKFWNFLLEAHKAGLAFSTTSVKKELLKGADELSEWVTKEVPADFFKSDSLQIIGKEYQEIMRWGATVFVNQASNVGNKNIRRNALKEFADPDAADAFILAQALYLKNNNQDCCIVTHEVYNPSCNKKILIPVAAANFNIPCISIYDFLDKYSDNFELKKS